MRNTFKSVVVGTAALSLISLAACGGDTSADGGETYDLRMSTQLSDSSPMVEGFRAWAEAVNERTDGAVNITVHPSAQLGSDEDVIEQALQGVNVAVLTDGGRMGNYVPDIGIIGMPYIADNYDEVKALTETETFASFDEQFEAEGIEMLCYNWYDGPRNFYTNKEINTPEDLNGQRIRTPGAPTWSESVAALGATPVAMPFTESYNALQSGSIDGVEAQSTAAYPISIAEVTSNMARTEHFQLANFIMVGKTFFDTLPQEYQQVLSEECKSAAAENAELVQQKATEFEDLMVEEGLVINEPDKEAFREASEAAYEKLGYTELRDQLWAEIGKE
jgi:TRAP-type C4-dicarboxylate transport system substrate-binding protein